MRLKRVRSSRRVQVVTVLVLLLSLVSLGTALADPSFSSNNFKTKWQRADKPVNDGSANPQRSWLWGPESSNPPTGQTEEYSDSPGGKRQVQYFDKARMELNNPATGAVTNGLLVKELISGNLAKGDATNLTRRAADDVPVAGDPDGNNGPTYASFIKLASLNNDNPSTNKIGQAVSSTLDKAGTVGSSADLGSKAKYVYFDDTLKHNIPDVLWTFMNQKGNVFVDGKLVTNQPVLGDNALAPWLDAMGLPITDAYWSKVTVAGQVKDVLIQAFERRVLTYTPSNPAAFQVEMGNVGQHYYRWRYSTKYDTTTPTPTTAAPTTAAPGTPTATPTKTATPTPTAVPTTAAPTGCNSLPANGTVAYPVIKCGPAGMEVILYVKQLATEDVSIAITYSNGKKETVDATSYQEAYYDFATTTATPQGKVTFDITGKTSSTKATAYFWADAPVTKPTVLFAPNPGKATDPNMVYAIVGFPTRPGSFEGDKPYASFDLKFTSKAGDSYLIDGRGNAQGATTNRIPTGVQKAGEWTLTVISGSDRTIQASVTYVLQ